jgi:hypothetical protein
VAVTKRKRSDELLIDRSRAPGEPMGIVPWQEEKLAAIHKSVLLLLKHTRRLVNQKDHVVQLLLAAQADKAAILQDVAILSKGEGERALEAYARLKERLTC